MSHFDQPEHRAAVISRIIGDIGNAHAARKAANLLYFVLALTLFFISAFSADANALEAFAPSESMDGVFIGKYVEHYVDPSKQLTLADIRSETYRSQFVAVNNDTLDFGLTDAAHWIHLTVKNPADAEIKWIMQAEHALLNHIEVYEIDQSGEITFHEGGNQIPFSRRDIAFRKNAFTMAAPPGASGIYIKYWPKWKAVANCSLTAWGSNNFLAHNNIDTLLLGLYFGAMFVMCLYNLIIYFSVRDTVYLRYVAYILAAGLSYFSMNGLAFQYLWPSSSYISLRISIGLCMLAFVLAISFSRSFLNTKTLAPALDKILLAMGIFCALDAVLILIEAKTFPYAVTVAYLSGLVFPPLLLYAGIRCLMAGFRQARFYVLAWTVYLAGVLLYFFKDIGVLPYSFVTAYSMQIGTLADVILLSLALADRIKILREEKEMAEARTMDILVKSKEGLEAQVALRTAEHRKAREEAENATLLKDKFVSLVAHDLSSPMASVHFALKQLAEGRKGALEEGQKSFLLKIIRSSSGLVDTINNLLSHDRLDSGTMKIEAVPVEMRGLVDGVIERVHLVAASKGIQMENRIPAGVTVKADFHLFEEVVQNLLVNAIKYSHPGGLITVYQPEQGSASLAVRDHGIGISPALLPSLFSNEVKTSAPGTEGETGAGLGLPLCNDIMKAHGGTITAEQAEGGGSVFHLEFPAFTTAVEHA